MATNKILLTNIYDLNSFCFSLAKSLNLKTKNITIRSILKQKLSDKFKKNENILFVFVWDKNETFRYFEQFFIGKEKLEYLHGLNHEPIPNLGNMHTAAVYETLISGFNENNFVEDARRFAMQELSELSELISELSDFLNIDLEIVQTIQDSP